MTIEQAIGETASRHFPAHLNGGDCVVIGLYVRDVLGIPYDQLRDAARQTDLGDHRNYRGSLTDTYRYITQRLVNSGATPEEVIDHENIDFRVALAARRLRIDQTRVGPEDPTEIPINERNRIDDMASLCAAVVRDAAERMLPSPRYEVVIFDATLPLN